MNDVVAVVLAAGTSTRFGRNKLLLPFGAGSVVGMTVARVLASTVSRVVVVTGHERELVVRSLPEAAHVSIAHNPNYAAGEMLSSLQTGLLAAPATACAALVVLGDLPLVEPSLIDRLMLAHSRGCGAIITPTFRGQRGHPVLFDRSLWPELLDLAPGHVPREIVRRHAASAVQLAVANATPLIDVDTPEAYARAVAYASASADAQSYGI